MLLPFVLAALTAPVPAASAPAAAATIHIENFTFVPSTVTVRTNQSVTFVNDDDEAHTVTAKDKSFDSEGLDSQRSWTHVFTQSGTFAYFCELHPSMKATIVVAGAAAKPASR